MSMHHSGAFRAAGMSCCVIARSGSDDAIQSLDAARFWIASLASQ